MIVGVDGDANLPDDQNSSGLGDLAVMRPRGLLRRELATGDQGVLGTLQELFLLFDEALLDPG